MLLLLLLLLLRRLLLRHRQRRRMLGVFCGRPPSPDRRRHSLVIAQVVKLGRRRVGDRLVGDRTRPRAAKVKEAAIVLN